MGVSRLLSISRFEIVLAVAIHAKFSYFMPQNDSESIYVSLVSSRLKNSFKRKYGHLEPIHAYLVDSCLINSFEMKCECLESIWYIQLIHA